MSKNKVLVGLVGMFLLLAGFTLGKGAPQPTQKDKQAEFVFSVCNYSRLRVSGQLEELCGQVQDDLGYEYLCKERNKLPTTSVG